MIAIYLADLIRYHRWLHANDMTTFEHIQFMIEDNDKKKELKVSKNSLLMAF